MSIFIHLFILKGSINFTLEIGRYAFHCGNANAVHYFSDKLQLPVKESTVRKFKKAWMSRNGVEQVKKQKSFSCFDFYSEVINKAAKTISKI